MGEATGTNSDMVSGAIGIAGVGLIGGSLAAAVKSRGLFQRVIGFGRSVTRLEAARDAGLIDEFAIEYGPICSELDLFVSCLPVDRIAESIRSAAARMQPGTVTTDAGSVKHSICQTIGAEPAPGVAFIGSHPLAGSEKQGHEHAEADLFLQRTCIVTPTGSESPSAIDRVVAFWNRLGSEVVSLSPDAHDAILARTSHVPHLIASALAALPAEEELQFAAGGFRDTTRVAAGDPDLWSGILLANRSAVENTLNAFIEQCDLYRTALMAGDTSRLRQLLAVAKMQRDSFASIFNHGTR